jgi:putative membrane protein
MTNKFRLAAGVVLLASVASTGFAQTTTPTTPASPQQATVKASVPSTADFLTKAEAGNKFEIESSKLALDKSKAEAVRTFANMMVKDHGEAAAKMKSAVTEAKLSAPPDALDAKHKAMLDDLAKKEGPAFDKAYVEAQLKGHEETVALFQAYANGGDNPRIKQFAKDLLPTLRMHLEHVRKIKV